MREVHNSCRLVSWRSELFRRSLSSQTNGMNEVAFQDFERGCVTEKEPTHLPLGCSIKKLVKVSKTLPPFHVETCQRCYHSIGRHT